MDSLTQIVLGAAVGEAVLGRKVGNKAILWGAIGGTIPDLDVLLRLFVDDITATEMHRAFSHSILFSLIFAPIFGWLIDKIHAKEKVGWKGWAWLMFGALFTHPLLDAHTSWGTMLLWPYKYKVAYNTIFIIDPIYTIPFLICVIWAMTVRKDRPKRRKINNIGLIISSSYLALTILLKGIGYYHFTNSLENQNITYKNFQTCATPFNTILWTALAETDDKFLIGYYSLLDGNKEVEFMEFERNLDLLGPMKDEELVSRLARVSEGWYTITKDGDKTYFNDMRFGQIGITNEPDMFGFSQELYYEGKELKMKGRERENINIGDALSSFMNRIVGTKKE